MSTTTQAAPSRVWLYDWDYTRDAMTWVEIAITHATPKFLFTGYGNKRRKICRRDNLGPVRKGDWDTYYDDAAMQAQRKPDEYVEYVLPIAEPGLSENDQ